MFSHRKSISVKQWMTRIFLAIVLVILGTVFAIVAYVGREMQKQVFASEEAVLSLYMEKLDDAMENMDRYLLTLPSSNTNLSELLLADQESTRYYYAEMEIYRELGKTVLTNETFDGLFVYDNKNSVFIQGTNSRAAYSQGNHVKTIMRNWEDRDNYAWTIKKEGGEAYLVRAVRHGSLLCGAWISFDNLTLPLRNIDLGESGFSLFVDAEGIPLSHKNEIAEETTFSEENDKTAAYVGGTKYFQNSKQSRRAAISLVTLVPQQTIMGKIYLIQLVLVLISCGMIGMLPVLIHSMNRKLYLPIREVSEKMRCVGEGDLSVKIESKSGFSELETVFTQFNAMVSQIKTLQEDIYEKQIREQQIQLQYLQVQIRPHFFLNSLNIIFSLAEIKRYDLIQEMTLCLVKYFRYMFHQTTSSVKLKEEKDHIENYMAIQELRCPGLFEFVSEIEPKLLEERLPPLLIQTFIENSIKYTSDMERKLTVTLRVSGELRDGGEYMHIAISDNGAGYPQAVLEQFSAGTLTPENSTHKIGICNIVQRLRLIYGEKAWIKIYNAPAGGAVSEIWIPIGETEVE